MGGKIYNGKTKGLAIQCIFHDCFENSTEIKQCLHYKRKEGHEVDVDLLELVGSVCIMSLSCFLCFC
mgnify:CR=1 FL=1